MEALYDVLGGPGNSRSYLVNRYFRFGKINDEFIAVIRPTRFFVTLAGLARQAKHDGQQKKQDLFFHKMPPLK